MSERSFWLSSSNASGREWLRLMTPIDSPWRTIGTDRKERTEGAPVPPSRWRSFRSTGFRCWATQEENPLPRSNFTCPMRSIGSPTVATGSSFPVARSVTNNVAFSNGIPSRIRISIWRRASEGSSTVCTTRLISWRTSIAEAFTPRAPDFEPSRTPMSFLLMAIALPKTSEERFLEAERSRSLAKCSQSPLRSILLEKRTSRSFCSERMNRWVASTSLLLPAPLRCFIFASWHDRGIHRDHSRPVQGPILCAREHQRRADLLHVDGEGLPRPPVRRAMGHQRVPVVAEQRASPSQISRHLERRHFPLLERRVECHSQTRLEPHADLESTLLVFRRCNRHYPSSCGSRKWRKSSCSCRTARWMKGTRSSSKGSRSFSSTSTHSQANCETDPGFPPCGQEFPVRPASQSAM